MSRPTFLVGVHAALAGLLILFGLSFLADPCEGGDLCLGGVVALFAFGVAAVGLVGLVVCRLGRRASPLLVWDSLLVGVATSTLGQTSGDGPTATVLAFDAMALLGIVGGIVAGVAVAPHRIERLVAVAAIVILGFWGRSLPVIPIGLLLLAPGIGVVLFNGKVPKELAPDAPPPDAPVER